eukprot:TRINITY_DN14753_c0_g1_i2.p1 TRINITY_DN14753_c0_g1~~TRINITY_DN14753_c0_g1_i2.p1  ORF type:complete len:180 (+),score=6.93 TRINITY_DN14753_c0_g1_i2:2-541(+)
MKKIIFLIFISALTFTLFAQNQAERSYVVMISMDGFRWDYPDKVATPNLHYVAKHGVKAQSLRPAFPTKTFPNHYAMATGLYPDHNGIVNNSFYDPEMNAHYSMGDSTKDNPAFYLGEPIWNTAEKQGVKTASFYWAVSYTHLTLPTICSVQISVVAVSLKKKKKKRTTDIRRITQNQI